MTFIRCPDGVGGQSFFEKNVPNGAPDWVRTVRLSGAGIQALAWRYLLPVLTVLPGLNVHTRASPRPGWPGWS